GPVILLTVAIAALGIPGVEDFGRVHAVLVIAALLVAASHFSVAVINWTSTLSVAPQTLCRMDLDDGIPDALRTLVAVPCMLSSEAEVDELVAALEIRYLANRDPNLYFALLSDYSDAPAQRMPDDAALLARARAGIEALNQTHEPDGPPRFCLLHRQRLWNAAERVWMGRERKRGKLAELNDFLRGDGAADLHLVVGDAQVLQRVNFVITLDADTELPPQSAQRLVATLAHPLNRPRLDHAKRRVIEGYGVLQPRVSVGASRGVASALARLYSDEIGLDPYTRLVSDVYQDLYAEASYIGKGIYDVDAFHAVTGSRFPDNLILSHDLLEGSYARTGLVSDVELFEHHPDRYDTDIRRRHRWTRGDWQVASWLLPWVPGPRGRWLRNTLSSHHRWKLLDNLRRSLVPPALLVLLLNAWLLGSQPLYWTALVMAVIFASPLLISFDHFLARNPRMEWGLHFRLNWEAMLRRLQQTSLLLAMLAFEAIHNLDAIGRSLWRMLASHRHLLQWTPASELARRSAHSVRSYYRLMWPAPVLAVVVAALVVYRNEPSGYIAMPFLLLWALSPWLACVLSRPSRLLAEVELDASQRAFLGVMARRTWHFFDATVTSEHNYLPPDNYQEYPREQTAQRTSPTNIGMYLVSALSAWDFGYLTQPQMLARIEETLDSLEQLRRYHGHCYNWYDTVSLEPLPPAYVSSVDSGNLIGALLVLARGLDMLDEARVLPNQVWRGLRDSWHVCVEVAAQHPRWSRADAAQIDAALASLPTPVTSLQAQAERLNALAEQVDALVAHVGDDEMPADIAVDAATEFSIEPALPWLRQLQQQCRAALTELATCAPWLEHGAQASADTDLDALLQRLDHNPSLRRAAVLGAGAARMDSAADATTNAVRAALTGLPEWLRARKHKAQSLAARCRALTDVDYRPLWVRNQKLLSIGYNVDQHSRDNSTYDLLASEARLTSFVGIAQGKLPREHWFALGRLLTIAAGRPALLSWSGSMFEYLMPLLLMPSFDNTLLTRTCLSVIARQIGYGREQGVPWGISESAYNITDAHLVYQYRAFGVPGLGFKRGLADDLVIAPYASALAAILRPDAACRNLRDLHALGASGHYGFYEAVDYSPARLPKGAKFALVRTYMAHHQGMIFTALSAALNERPLQKRFTREPMFRANQLLLQEKVPAALSIDATTLHAEQMLAPQREVPGVARVITALDTSVPQLQLLSNGRYHTIISQTGGGYSQWGELEVNHWQQDATCDSSGMFCYVQDLDRGELWSNTWQPVRATAQHYAATFAQASAEYMRLDHGIETQTRIAISSEDDIELRRVRVTNRSDTRRRLALTRYVEWVMTRHSDAQAHPAFNKLFVESEFLAEQNALLARRRPRGDDEDPPYFLHLIGVRGNNIGPVSYETRRDVFIGGDRDTSDPIALTSATALANTSGAALDPIAALRREIVLQPGQTATIDIITGVATSRGAALELAARYADRDFGTRVFDLAWTREQVIRHQLNLVPGDVRLFTRMAGSVLYPDSAMRARGAATARPGVGQSGLWKYGISGDLPIVLVRIGSIAELPLVRQALQAHVYWHMHGLPVDLVVWNEDASGYRQELHDLIMGLIGSSAEAPTLDRPGGVFVRRSEHVSLDDRTLLLATARMVLHGRHGSISDQLPALEGRRTGSSKPLLRAWPTTVTSMAKPRDLQLFNGTGGFSADGSEYVIWLPNGVTTPLPWVNVLANAQFGSVISASGSAYSWNENAREFRLT
ncbi:MAG: cyclic beta 1-2 glucan synthetase, partial [Xanthomonadales bacterium]|nr:cyclic beta 1-2 glucan synthetase [Xanthomonadales bacterium]